jgi:DNA (cytosine-5)-methyltransferase 1
VHTWDIPEVFGPVSATERKLLEALLMLRRTERVRTRGDADPVRAHLLLAKLKRPVSETLHALLRKRYVKRVGEGYDLTNTFNGIFRRLEWDKPCYTVDTRFGNPRYFLHPRENRGFTVREAARIQGFPDDFIFTGTAESQYRQVGNAVPPPIARDLAVVIREAILART